MLSPCITFVFRCITNAEGKQAADCEQTGGEVMVTMFRLTLVSVSLCVCSEHRDEKRARFELIRNTKLY
jgi:hypothetical protein